VLSRNFRTFVKRGRGGDDDGGSVVVCERWGDVDEIFWRRRGE